MTVHKLPRKSSPSTQKQPTKPFISPVGNLPTLYTVVRLDGSYAVTTVQGGRVQMRGPKAFCIGWIEDNTQETA